MRGHVDIVDYRHVAGWAAPSEGERYAQLEVFVDGESVAKILASRYRQDLEAVGILEGHCAFEHRFERAVSVLDEARVEVRSLETGELLPGQGTAAPALLASSGYRAQIEERFVSAATPDVYHEDGQLVLAAHLFAESPDIEVTPAYGELAGLVSVEPVDDLPGRGTGIKPFIARVPMHPGPDADRVGFIVTPGRDIAPHEDSATLSPVLVSAPTATDWMTVPAFENWSRTSGAETGRELYVNGGWTTAQKVDALIREHLGRTGDLRILDWGTGCGRVLLPLARIFRPGDAYVGVDVDRFNIEWCQASIPEHRTVLSDIYPPLPLEPESFDVVFGISVMTHLTQAAQVVWLRELRRLLRPGGISILTVHGDHSLLWNPPSTEVVDDLISYGISDRQRDPNIQVAEMGYYRGTFQLRQQVLESWGAVMPIVAYLPTANDLVQDFVVLRRPDASTHDPGRTASDEQPASTAS